MLIDALAVSAAAGVAVAVTGPAFALAVRGRNAARRSLARSNDESRRRIAEAEGDVRRARDDLSRLAAETEHLIAARLPALQAHSRAPHVAVPGLLHRELAGTDLDRQHRAVLDAVAQGLADEGERVDEAGRAVVRGAMGRVHKMHLALQDQLRELRDDFPDADPALMGRLLRIEMYNEQLGRAAQAPGIACGSPPMMFRDQHHLVDVVVSAASRVKDFERRIDEPANHLVRRIGVAAKAVEPLRCILSELLANAVECSHGTLKVGVELHETQAGATIFVDDAGVGLNAEQLTRAEQLIGSRRPARLTDLGDPPKHGWAAVGEMVRQFGFLVTVKQGPYGGARAIVTVPMGLLVEMPADVEQSVHAPQPVRMDPSGAVHTMAHEVVAGPDPNRPQPPGAVSQLPRRRRRAARTGPAAAPAVSRGSQEARTPEVAARRWGAWQTGRNEGNAAVDRGHEDPTERT